MTTRLILFTLALSTSLLGACGGDDDGDGIGAGPVTQEAFNEGCRVDCEYRVECDPNVGTLEECIAGCTSDFAEVSGWLRGDAFVAITQCFSELTCAQDDNQCMTECRPTSVHETYEAQCRAILAPCIGTAEDVNQFCETTPMPTAQSDDLGIFCLMTPAVVQEMTACIPDGTACDAGLTCIQGVWERVGFD